MRSDNVKLGAERTPNRSLFYALGYTDEELERPLIGVVSAFSEIVPGHSHLDKLAQAVKDGVRMAGGTPVSYTHLDVYKRQGQDGTLTEDELQAVTAMDVSNQGIASLKGIEYFTNLESLNCRGNQLTQLDVRCV